MPYQTRRTPIGRRREQVSIQARTVTSDGIGGQVVTWDTVATPWAAVVPLDGRDQEAIAGGQLTVLHAFHFDLRYRRNTDTRPAPTMRLVWRDRTLEIRTVIDDTQRRERLIVQCAEVQDASAAS